MSEKVLVLIRETNTLWICDEMGGRQCNPIVISNVTHVEKDPMEWYDIFNKKTFSGFCIESKRSKGGMVK